MQASSVPLASRQRISSFTASNQSPGNTSKASLGYLTESSSWASTNVFSSLGSDRPHPPLAWAGVRHEVEQEEKGANVALSSNTARQCNQAVLLTCLYLSHEMVLREVGLYAWTLPHVKDPVGSTLRIMKQYSQQLRDLSLHTSLNVRMVPDPSRTTIQHHLQKARLAAGQDGYIVVLYTGHGIQEPPTEAGELWCYDLSFEDCAQQGTNPSEYIPILLFDVLTWSGSSTCYVWDCQHAGRFIRVALTDAQEIDSQLRAAAKQNPAHAVLHPAVYAKRQIHFAACGAHELLPRVPGMPDDLFTACLTTPLRIALLYHNLQTFPLTTGDAGKHVQKSHGYMAALLELMSLDLKARLWSELEAILHTIAWQTLDGPTYQMLFAASGDVVSNLAGGFLLSQRVMGSYRATPESIPAIPSSTSHGLWTTWDLILDNLFEQLPKYFDEEGDVTAWEKGLKLVSFMDDQLASILESDRPLFAADAPRTSRGAHSGGHMNGLVGGVGVGGSGITGAKGLSRLPIICKAALAPEYRLRACTALDACLRNLDVKGLTHAIQGGALDVAAHLLALEDETLAPMMISIWSSLVRHDVCVASLAASGRTAERLTSVPSVSFFLDSLERLMDEDGPQSKQLITQTAAVLATIANYVAGRQAPRFVKRTLTLSGKMLDKDQKLVNQWGALLIAEVLASIKHAEEDVKDETAMLQQQLLRMIDSPSVEDRATATYALSRWIEPLDRKDVLSIRPELDLASKVVRHAKTDGSGFVRKEVARLLQRALVAGGRWTLLVLWLFVIEKTMLVLPASRKVMEDAVLHMKTRIEIGSERKACITQLFEIIGTCDTLRTDPNAKVRHLALDNLDWLLGFLRPYADEGVLNKLIRMVFPSPSQNAPQYDSTKLVRGARSLGECLVDNWHDVKNITARKRESNELFEQSKLSLQAYLARDDYPQKSPEQLTGRPECASDGGYQMRYRLLEDSLVVAEQQNISSPDPWCNITFHSFFATVMSCNNTQDLLMWDWSSSRKTGSVRLDLSPDSVITSARFVNELFERVVVLAEISNGDIHVLSAGSDDPTKMKTISSFPALDLRQTLPNVEWKNKKLVTTWWRQSGKLCVGGPSAVVNIWDCPAERCCRVLSTNSSEALTTLITEPVSGNIILGGLVDGTVKLWDLRQSRKSPLMTWSADMPDNDEIAKMGGRGVKGVLKLGVVLGESKHITSACSNGLLRIHDLRKTTSASASNLVHPNGTSSASFQAHSGLMSTTSSLSRPIVSGAAQINWSIDRSVLSSLEPVSQQAFTLDNPFPTSFRNEDPEIIKSRLKPFAPYTVMHNLRPFLGVGYGTQCVLRGSGVGKGDDTDSGSYSFLRKQASGTVPTKTHD